MEENIEQNKSKSHKEFEELLNEDLSHRRFKENEIATGIIEEIGKKFVFIKTSFSSRFNFCRYVKFYICVWNYHRANISTI